MSLLYFSILVLTGCEEPNVRLDRLDPSVQATFIDVDSLLSMDATITEINEDISAINDRLEQIDSLILAGDQGDYTDEINSLNLEKQGLQQERSEISSQRSTIASGNILIERITAAESMKEITFTESRTNYRLPLNARSSTTELFIQYDGAIRSIRFGYETDTLLEERTVRILAKGLTIFQSDYDSVRLICDTLECSSSNAKAVLYL